MIKLLAGYFYMHCPHALQGIMAADRIVSYAGGFGSGHELRLESLTGMLIQVNHMRLSSHLTLSHLTLILQERDSAGRATHTP